MFQATGTQQEQEDELETVGLGMSAWPAAGVEEEVTAPFVLRSTAEEDVLRFWPWVNQVRGNLSDVPSMLTTLSATDTNDCITTTSIRDRNAAIQKDGVRSAPFSPHQAYTTAGHV